MSKSTARVLEVIPREKLREHNLAVQKEILIDGTNIKNFRESFKRRHKFDPMLERDKLPFKEKNFDWGEVRRQCMRESDSASSFVQVLRAGVQNNVNDMYHSTPTTYEDWVQVVTSSKDTELYAPLQGIGFPREVERSGKYPETRAMGLDIELKNRKYGNLYGVEMELEDDDQTGQFVKQSATLGQYQKLLVEVYVYAKLASVAGMQYADLKIVQCETQPSSEANYPYTKASAPFVGGGFNQPASFSVLNQASIQAGMIAQMSQLNILGLKMLVQPSRLLHGPAYSYDSAALLNSSFWPSTQGTVAGLVGGAYAENPIKGLVDRTQTRFMFKNDGTVAGDSKAWYLIDDSVPFFILQMREAAEVIAEAVNSGAAFETDVMRWKVRSRLNADFIDPRFIWQGNDGSVTS